MSWWKTAKPGDKVVCVDNGAMPNRVVDGWWVCSDLHGLECGQVYTIRAIRPSLFDGKVVVFLEEIIRPKFPEEPEEAGYHVRRFRPVQTRSTDTGMAILKRILNGASVREDA